MSSTTLNPSLKTFLSGIVAFLISFVCLLMPANPDNVNLTVKGNSCGTDDFFGYPYCTVTVQMENKTNRKMEKPDYAVLEKESNGEWVHIARGKIPEEVHWTMIHGGDTTETFYFYTESDPAVSSGEYRITVYYTVKGLTSGFEGQSSTVFTVN